MRFVLLTLIFVLSAQQFLVAGVSWENIGHYSVEKLKAILTTEAETFNPNPPQYDQPMTGATLYRIRYESVIPERNNRRITASGLVAIPDSIKDTSVTRKPAIVSYQHGTVFGKHDVPSFPDQSYEARLMIALFVGQGDVVIAPDYFGLGESDGKEGYVVVKSQQQACIDFLSAAQQLLTAEGISSRALFLCGWSQGGFVTQAFLQRLEQSCLPVTAAATVACPSDPFGFINGFLNFPRETDASWRSILFILLPFSYEHYYNVPGLARSFLTPELYDLSRRIYERDGVTSSDLPDGISKLVRKEYNDPIYFADTLFGRLLREVSPYRWVFQTPMRMYYSENDEILRPAQARLAADYQESMGNDKVISISLENKKLSHRGAFAYAVPEWKKWVDSFSKK